MLRSSLTQLRRFRKRRALLGLLSFTLLAANANAADILVTTNADSGTGSLREAFTTAAAGDVIVFDIPGSPTITLLSDLPTLDVDISFANDNTPPVAIDRNGFAALALDGSLVNPTALVVIDTSGAPATNPDIIAGGTTTIFGNGEVSGNLVAPGTVAPGASADAGSIGTLDVTGDLDVSAAQVQLDISGTANDVINVTGEATVTAAVLVPNFIGSDFEINDQFVVLNANPIDGTFANQADAFALPNNPFLQALADPTLAPNGFGFLIEDNDVDFVTVVTGCNQLSAAGVLDDLRARATPPAAVSALRNDSTDQVVLAVNQLSGSIYPSLIGAEINHIQNNLESVRDRVALQFDARPGELAWTPWIRGYGVSGQVEPDECQTPGYRQELGGMELGCGLSRGGPFSAYVFAHLAGGNLYTRGVDQHADIDSYRIGGLVEYADQNVYLIAAGGAGVQDYDVQRSLTAFEGSSLVQSSFDGSSQFGYFEMGANYLGYWAPYLALHTTRVDLDAITEAGDADFALSNNGGAGDSLRGVLGLSTQKSALTPIGLATTRLRFGWLHEYLDASETIVSQVAGDGTPTGPLTDRGVDPGIDWGFVRMQVDMGMLLGGHFSFAYEGQFNSDSSYNALMGGTRWVY
jgi:outer membrane autotransporter protein